MILVKRPLRVYKNGFLLSGAVYDSNTGFVTLNESVNELDQIYIVYEEESADAENGFVTAGTGFVYNILPDLKFDVSFGGKYQAVEQSDVEGKNSFSALTTGLSYNTKNLKAWEAVSTTIETQQKTDTAFITKNEAGIQFKNDSADLQAVSSTGFAINTKNGTKASDYVNTNVKGSYKIFGINIGGDMALSYLDLKSAGHLLKTDTPLFNLIDFGEIYRFSNDELEKKDYFT